MLFSDIATWFSGVQAEFTLNFITSNRWRLIYNGLLVTLQITLVACLMGIVIGIIVATVRTTKDKAGHTMRKGLPRTLLVIVDWVCRLYITVIRGTPIVIQLMIMYFVIFVSSRNGVLVAILAFGLNSGAYVSEIFRGGIMSIDAGQFEAGRSLGLNYVQTMGLIIAPQVLKNVLPTLANEFIVLLKETAVAGYVAVGDLTFAANRIRGVTYSAFMPLIAVALIYLTLVMFLTWLVGKLERRLRQSDNR
ncbi:MAG: amino acid ABC transporter permease [Clostridia bacterium]|nr:amino acid ABC transporter permease [Clostridia bacterium]